MTDTKTRHTPGPWLIGRDKDEWGRFNILGGPLKIHVAKASACKDREASVANARLIAAAPELLAALELFFQVNEAGIERGTTLGEQLAIAGFFENARAAIAKAKEER